jgi:membrane protein
MIAIWSANSGAVGAFRCAQHRIQGAVVLTAIAVGAVVFLPTFLSLFGLGTWSERLIDAARWPFLLVAAVGSLSLVYRYGPSRGIAKSRWISGSVTAAILWLGMSMLFSWYVAQFDSYNRVYGSLGAVAGFMTWMWFSIVVVLLGAELNAEMELQTAVD